MRPDAGRLCPAAAAVGHHEAVPSLQGRDREEEGLRQLPLHLRPQVQLQDGAPGVRQQREGLLEGHQDSAEPRGAHQGGGGPRGRPQAVLQGQQDRGALRDLHGGGDRAAQARAEGGRHGPGVHPGGAPGVPRSGLRPRPGGPPGKMQLTSAPSTHGRSAAAAPAPRGRGPHRCAGACTGRRRTGRRRGAIPAMREDLLNSDVAMQKPGIDAA
mmetsp:Transcript_29850/g.84076  ORF Transcript_29850/g.84076 Transcript_29850/m.84076 type:complete len:213 (-) Transcript_29850:170-808(-)